MKNTFKYLLGTLALAGTMVACSPEEFDHMSEAGIVEAAGFGQQINIQVDQTTNQVTFTLNDAKEIYPIWEIDLGKGKTEVSTVNGFKRIFTLSGDYTVRCKIGNKNGISSGWVEEKFHLNNSIVDFTKYTTMLSKAPWYIDNTVKGHLGCGPSGTEGTEWWSANPDEKAAFGVYDNALTFTADMKYTFDPGASGTLYANWGVTSNGWQDTYWSGIKDDDFNVPVELQNSTYNFEVDGDDLYLTFPKGTYFPYIANDDIWNTPRFLVVNMTTKQMTLRIDNGGIAWQFILTTQHEVKEVFNGFDVNSEDNLWKQANASFNSLYYAHGGDWAGLPDYEHSEENGVYTVNLPTATDNQWQAQYCLKTDLTSSIIVPGTKYDFSCKITSTQDLKGVTLKLTSPTDDPSLVNNQNGPLASIPAMEETVVYFTELEAPEIDGNYKFVFDFGGNPDNTEIVIKDIVIIDHSKNKVPVPSGDEPGKDDPSNPGANVTFDEANNLWNGEVEIETYNAQGSDWHTPAELLSYEQNGKDYTVYLPSESNDRWQAQFKLHSNISTSADKNYDLRVILTPNQDVKAATVKWVLSGGGDNDAIFYTEDRHDIAAFEDNVIVLANAPGIDMDKLSLVLDFGGNAAGTEVKISGIAIQEHQGPKVVSWDYNSDSNLWKKATLTMGGIYYAHGGDWAGLPAFEASVTNPLINATLPTATDNEWQAQLPVITDIVKGMISPDKKYDFHCVIVTNNNHPGMTLKLVEDGENNTPGSLGINYDANAVFYQPGIALEAYEENEVSLTGLQGIELQDNPLKLVIDFGKNVADSEFEIKDIIFREAE